MAIIAPPKDAFFNHQVVMIFHVKKARYAEKKTIRDLYLLGLEKTVCSTNKRGTKAINNNGIKPFGSHANPNNKPVRIDSRYNWYFFN